MTNELFSIEVFVRKVYSLDVECHLPSLSFRLLDFPTQTIHITEQERIYKIQEKIASNPGSIRDLSRLKNSKGDIIFNKGKSCLFPLSFESAYSQLAEIPLYVVLADIAGSSPKFIGSIGISLLKIMDTLRDCITLDPSSICNEAVQGSYPIRNLMGSRVAKVAVEVKLFYYGTNLVHHIPVLSTIADSTHDTTLGKSDHLASNEAISSIMGDIQHNKTSELFNKTSDLFSPEESDSDKDKDETDKDKDETDLNPPPLFYQAVPRDNQAVPRDVVTTTRDNKTRDNKTRDNKTSDQNVETSAPDPTSPKRVRTRSVDSTATSDSRLDKFMKFSQANQGDVAIEKADIIDRGYDPKRFDLIRAVLTELTYLTDFLDPNLEEPKDSVPPKTLSNIQTPPEKRSKFPERHPKPPSFTKPDRRTPKRYGLTNSYILRLSRLGPDKALEALTQHMGKQSASTILDKYYDTPSKPASKSLVDRAAVRAASKPILVSTECQTDQAPKVAWEDQEMCRRDQEIPRGTAPTTAGPAPVHAHVSVGTVPAGTQTFSVAQPDPFSAPQGLAGTAPFSVPADGQPSYSTPFQSTGSMSMAQVLAAMQALARPLTGMSQNMDHSLRRANSNQEYCYSDNFEEPSCISLARSSQSPLSRPISRAANSRLSSRMRTPRHVEEEEEEDPTREMRRLTPVRRSTRNTRYERNSSVKTVSTRDQDSSSTTSTALSTQYSPAPATSSRPATTSRSLRRRNSKRSQTSLGTESTSQLRLHSSHSGYSTSKACQTPVPARSLSTQTDLVSESEEDGSTRGDGSEEDGSTTVLTVLQSPIRDLQSPTPTRDLVSDHSSLKSGSIYMGSDIETEEEEEDPLKLSYLLSTESVQFSDEEQPTSLLKLCSPSEARAHNRFMYTF